MGDIEDMPTAAAVGASATGDPAAMPVVFANRYRVRALLGQGGMGAVFRVLDTELDEEIALKVLHAGLASNGSAVDRFRREVKLARRVTHANVARTYDVGQHEDVRFLTMELVDGDPITSLLCSGKRPPLAETLRIAENIARGLSAAHAAGVVHRDLKPDNVMRCGADGRIVITDFGIARLAEGLQSPDDLQLTVNQVIGTPAYMAPEQLTAGAIDGRTDVYAFGTLLFELLTGVLPFRRDTVIATVAARLNEDAPDPRSLAPDVPEPVAVLVNRTLARRREDRPAAETLLQEIERLRGGGDRHDRSARLPPGTGTAGIITGAIDVELPGASQAARVIAVAPVDAPVDAPANAPWSADDLSAALADGISTLRGVRVLSPRVVRDAARSVGAREAARALGASWLVEASLRHQSGRGRARIRLIEVEGQTQLWAAGPHDVAEGAAFELEDLLVGALTTALRERLGDASGRAVAPEVRDLCARARDAARLRTLPGAWQALAVLEEGLARFPGEPSILSLMGATLARLYGFTGSSDPDLAARAEEASLRAIAADPTLGEAYQAVGLLRTEQGETRAAVRAFQEALARAPLLSDAHAMLGILLADTGHPDEALRRFDVALRLDPLSWSVRLERARTLELIGDRAGADADLAAVGPLRMSPLLVRLVVWRGDRARAGELAEAFERTPTGAQWEAAAPVLRAFSRGECSPDVEKAFAIAFSRSRMASRNRCRVIGVAVEFYAAFGDNETALTWLEKAEFLPFIDLLWLDRCVCLAGIRSDPRFARVRAAVAARAAAIWR